MKKIVQVALLFLISINIYASGENNYQHYDKADIKNRAYGTNFKDLALMICMQIANKKLNKPIDKDLENTIGALWSAEWFSFDAENTDKTKRTINELNRLSEQYITSAGTLKHDPNATTYAFKCLNFYHSDDLDDLMRSFVISPKISLREEFSDKGTP